MSKGWIYLRKNVNLKGEVMAYCIGKTGNEKKRRKTYRKENPFIEHVEDYKASNMHAAETILKDFIKDNDMQLVGRSSEWLRKECFDQFYQKWSQVKGDWWVNKPKKPKRKYLQPLGAGPVKPLPPVGKPRPLPAAAIEATRTSSALANKISAEKARIERQGNIYHASHLETCNVPAKKKTSAFWQAIGEAMVVGGGTLLGIMALAGIAVNMPSIISFLGTVISMVLVLGFLWLLGSIAGKPKRRRRKAW